MRVTPPFGFAQGREPVERQMGVFQQPASGFLGGPSMPAQTDRAALETDVNLSRARYPQRLFHILLEYPVDGGDVIRGYGHQFAYFRIHILSPGRFDPDDKP